MTSHPLRVLQVSNRPRFGGVGIYTDSLSRELAELGVEVGWFYVGEYDPWLVPHLKRSISDDGIRCYALRNCPNLHVATGVFNHPADEMKQTSIEAHFGKVLDEFSPDIVHFQDLGGLCASLIEMASERSICTVTTLNNYWSICAQMTLVYSGDGDICAGPNGGRNCARCITYSSASSRKKRLALSAQPLKRTPVCAYLYEKLGKPMFLHFYRRYLESRESSAEASDEQATPCLSALFGEREKYNRYLLSQKVTINIAVASFVKELFVQWGVPSDRLIVQSIGTRAAEFLRPTPRAPRAPLTFGYIGILAPQKGAHVLIEAYNRVVGSDTRLLIYGEGPSRYANNLENSIRRPGVEFRGAYHYEDLPKILSEMDALVVPPVWYDNGPQVVFEGLSAGVPVIGARIGGIPDFVRDGENGLLFEPGDATELGRKLSMLVAQPSLLNRYRANAHSTKTIGENANELVSLYQSLLSSGCATHKD